MSTTILGIDPGTSCGWAILRGDTRVASGVWDLRPRRHEGGGMRYLRLRRYLEEVLEAVDVDAVGYEEVHRHLGVAAAHVYGGIVATIGAVCEERAVPYTGIPVVTAKRAATGSGRASKSSMVEAAWTRWGDAAWPGEALSDDEADALWIAAALAEVLR